MSPFDNTFCFQKYWVSIHVVILCHISRELLVNKATPKAKPDYDVGWTAAAQGFLEERVRGWAILVWHLLLYKKQKTGSTWNPLPPYATLLLKEQRCGCFSAAFPTSYKPNYDFTCTALQNALMSGRIAKNREEAGAGCGFGCTLCGPE